LIYIIPVTAATDFDSAFLWIHLGLIQASEHDEDTVINTVRAGILVASQRFINKELI
jgi:hypothetical protein